MNEFTRYFILGALICAALASYGYGSASGLWSFIVAGALFEVSFWLGLLNGSDK